jgi:hypothetical protein
MEAMGIIVGLLVLLAPVLIVAAIIYFVVRRRNGKEGVTTYQALMAYFYAMTSASIVVASVGMGYLLSSIFNHYFDSYEPLADDVTLGIALLVTGLAFCISHIFGRRAFEKKEKQPATALRRVYLFFMLTIYSITGLISLPMAAYETARHFINGSLSWENPAAALATAIVVLPLWIYYLVLVIRETRTSKKEETAQ